MKTVALPPERSADGLPVRCEADRRVCRASALVIGDRFVCRAEDLCGRGLTFLRAAYREPDGRVIGTIQGGPDEWEWTFGPDEWVVRQP